MTERDRLSEVLSGLGVQSPQKVQTPTPVVRPANHTPVAASQKEQKPNPVTYPHPLQKEAKTWVPGLYNGSAYRPDNPYGKPEREFAGILRQQHNFEHRDKFPESVRRTLRPADPKLLAFAKRKALFYLDIKKQKAAGDADKAKAIAEQQEKARKKAARDKKWGRAS